MGQVVRQGLSSFFYLDLLHVVTVYPHLNVTEVLLHVLWTRQLALLQGSPTREGVVVVVLQLRLALLPETSQLNLDATVRLWDELLGVLQPLHRSHFTDAGDPFVV